jgi:hypothetical protein
MSDASHLQLVVLGERLVVLVYFLPRECCCW